MTEDQPTMESVLQTLREVYEREEADKRLVKVALGVVSLSTVALVVFFSTSGSVSRAWARLPGGGLCRPMVAIVETTRFGFANRCGPSL